MNSSVRQRAPRAALVAALFLLLLAAGCQPWSEFEPIQGRLTTLSGEGPPPGYISGTIPPEYQGCINPFTPQDVQAISQGAIIYSTGAGDLSCSYCHGGNGLGDGPRALKMDQLPANFSYPAMQNAFRNHQDYVFWWVSAGVDKTVMPSFQNTLTETQIWQVITYEWQLGEQQSTEAASGPEIEAGR